MNKTSNNNNENKRDTENKRDNNQNNVNNGRKLHRNHCAETDKEEEISIKYLTRYLAKLKIELLFGS